jgi:predicted RNA-binding Zn-ribbon protein involved in translation (DUF1610 family)
MEIECPNKSCQRAIDFDSPYEDGDEFDCPHCGATLIFETCTIYYLELKDKDERNEEQNNS